MFILACLLFPYPGIVHLCTIQKYPAFFKILNRCLSLWFGVYLILIELSLFLPKRIAARWKKRLWFMLYVRDTKSWERDTKSYVWDTKSYTRDIVTKSYVRETKSYVRDSVTKSYVMDSVTKSYVRDYKSYVRSKQFTQVL